MSVNRPNGKRLVIGPIARRVNLPLNGRMPNPVDQHDDVVAYLDKTWLSIVPMWSMGVLRLLQDSFGSSFLIEKSNQFTERSIGNVKHVEGAGHHADDLGRYIIFRWNGARESTRVLVKNMEMLEHSLDLHKPRTKRVLVIDDNRKNTTEMSVSMNKNSTTGTMTSITDASDGRCDGVTAHSEDPASLALAEEEEQSTWKRRKCEEDALRRQLSLLYFELNPAAKKLNLRALHTEIVRRNSGQELTGFGYQTFLSWYNKSNQFQNSRRLDKARREWMERGLYCNY